MKQTDTLCDIKLLVINFKTILPKKYKKIVWNLLTVNVRIFYLKNHYIIIITHLIIRRMQVGMFDLLL